LRKKITSWVGLLFGGIFLFIAFYRVDWDPFYSAVVSIKLGWVLAVVASLLVSMWLRALRWFLFTGLPREALAKVWDAACVGYIGTAIYPARAGDVLRMVRLQKTTGMGGGQVIGSAVIDRILDGLSLVILLLAVVFLQVGGLRAHQALWAVALFFLVAAAGVMLFIVTGHRARKLFVWLSGKWRWGQRLNRWFDECIAGLQMLRSPKLLSFVFILQLVISLVDMLALWLLFFAFGWTLPFAAALVTLVYLAAVISLPSSPGYVGVYQIATLFSLPTFGVAEASAVAYGTVLQVVNLLLFIGVGAYAYRHRS
jgi:uncharacterized protein (TIRG00374 family)